MSGAGVGKKFTQVQQNFQNGRGGNSFTVRSDTPFVSLNDMDSNQSHVAALDDSQASGLASFFAANIKAQEARAAQRAQNRLANNHLLRQVSNVQTQGQAQALQANLKAAGTNNSTHHLEANTPQRASVTKAQPKANPHTQAPAQRTFANVANDSMTALNAQSNNLVRSMGNKPTQANIIKANHSSLENTTNAFAKANLVHYEQDSLSNNKAKEKAISLESLGPLVSFNARLLQEYYFLNFSRLDAVIADMQLNGLHVPLAVVNPKYGILLIHLCSETYDELMRNHQLIHNNKKHFLHVRDQFVKHFAEPHNEFSLQDLKHVTYVLQCYENLSAQEVVKLFPAQSILNTPNTPNPSKVYTRWPVAGMVQRVHAHLERYLANPSAGNNSQNGIKWICKSSQVPFYLSNNQSEASLFESLAIPELDRAHKEVSLIINQRANFRGQYSKFARPNVEQVLRPRNTTVELEGQEKVKNNQAINIAAQPKSQQLAALMVGGNGKADIPAPNMVQKGAPMANRVPVASTEVKSIAVQNNMAQKPQNRALNGNMNGMRGNGAPTNNQEGGRRLPITNGQMPATAVNRQAAMAQVRGQVNAQPRTITAPRNGATNPNRNMPAPNPTKPNRVGSSGTQAQLRNTAQPQKQMVANNPRANGNNPVRVNTERAFQQAQKAAQMLKRAPQKISQSTKSLEQKINVHANPMVMVGTFDFD